MIHTKHLYQIYLSYSTEKIKKDIRAEKEKPRIIQVINCARKVKK